MSENKGKIYGKMVDILKDFEAIEKAQTNTLQNFKFRGIDDVLKAANPIFQKHGVFILPTVIDEKKDVHQTAKGTTMFHCALYVKYTFMADDGSFVEATLRGEAMDSGDKAGSKALSMALKYLLVQTFVIPTQNTPDADAHSPEIKPKGGAKLTEEMEMAILEHGDSESLRVWANDQTELCKNKVWVAAVQTQLTKLQQKEKAK